jgi:hypothetical protein
LIASPSIGLTLRLIAVGSIRDSGMALFAPPALGEHFATMVGSEKGINLID